MFQRILLLTALTISCATPIYTADKSTTEEVGPIVKFFRNLFRTEDHQAEKLCAKCQTGNLQGESMVIPAGTSAGGGSAGPAGNSTIGSLTINQHGSPNGANMSDEVRIALEKEKTRQLELANAHNIQLEHERNKWLSSLGLYFDTRLTQQLEKGQREGMSEFKMLGIQLLGVHHQALSELVDRHGATELKKLPLMLAHDTQKTKLLHEQALEKLTLIGHGIRDFTSDRERMVTTTLALSGAALGIYAAKRGTKVLADVAAANLMQPALVSETSRISVTRLLKSPVKTVFGTKEVLPKVICNPELQAQINTYIASIKQGHVDKQPFRHALFYGTPGTGKTLLARQIARNLGMEFAEVPGPNVSQYHKQDAIREVNKLFNWASSSRKGTVLFFDECDALAPRRTGETSEQTRAVLNAVLAHTGSETTKVLMIGATNEPSLLDPAFLNRLDERLEFTKPDRETRAKLLHQYFQRYVNADKKLKVEETVDRALDEAAYGIDGFSGREISQLARAIRAKAATIEAKTVTPELVREITAQKIDQQKRLLAHTANSR